MMKVIAVISSLDTKGEDVQYLIELIEKFGHRAFVIDVGTRKQSLIKPDISSIDIARKAGYKWEYPVKMQRHTVVDVLRKGISKLLPELYNTGKIDAAISIGGLQNTNIAVSGMKQLPIGVPKIMVSTMASGKRAFGLIVDHSDIVPFPSITDFSGGNPITNAILRNAVSALVGMVEKSGRPIEVGEEILIGVTTMGVVNEGYEKLVKSLKMMGYRVVSFHSTGVGGRLMDDFIEKDVIKATVELSLHEIVAELFGGYSAGDTKRLFASCVKAIPQVVVPGGCDFIDYEISGLDKSIFKRKYVLHNSEIGHFKLYKKEAEVVGKEIALRLNKAKGPVTVVIPLQGVREGTKEGEPLYDPDVDTALFNSIRENIKKDNVKVIDVNANINDDTFIKVVSDELKSILSGMIFNGDVHNGQTG